MSAHAYSPPLTAMNYYDLDEHRLNLLAHVETDDPETELTRRPAQRVS